MFAFTFFRVLLFAGVRSGPHERRLINDLLAKYNNLERPVLNESEALKLNFGLTLQQIIDVVSNLVQALSSVTSSCSENTSRRVGGNGEVSSWARGTTTTARGELRAETCFLKEGRTDPIPSTSKKIPPSRTQQPQAEP